MRMSSPYVQSALMGFAFLLAFSAYDTIQVFAKRLYPDDIGPNMSMCIYIFFTLTEFVAPAVVNKLGPRLSMSVGMLCYASVVVAGLIYFLTGQAPWIVLFSGCLLGAGAALLWTGQGQMILNISSETNRGKVFAIFWSLYRGASISGGLLSFTYFSTHTGNGNVGLYIIFLTLVVCGALATTCLMDPAKVDKENGALADSADTPEQRVQHEKSWAKEVQDTVSLFFEPAMLLLALLFWTSGGNEPYILSGFTDRWFNKRSTGMEMVIYFSLSVVGAMATGWMLDWFSNSGRQRQGAITVVSLFSLVHCTAFAGAAVLEMTYERQRYDLVESGIILPTLVFCLWGLSDAMINAFCYWIIGQLYTDGSRRAQAIGFLKMLNSAGHVVGYAILPEHRVSATFQLWFNIVAYLVGAAGAFAVSARVGTERTFERKEVE